MFPSIIVFLRPELMSALSQALHDLSEWRSLKLIPPFLGRGVVFVRRCSVIAR